MLFDDIYRNYLAEWDFLSTFASQHKNIIRKYLYKWLKKTIILAIKEEREKAEKKDKEYKDKEYTIIEQYEKKIVTYEEQKQEVIKDFEEKK